MWLTNPQDIIIRGMDVSFNDNVRYNTMYLTLSFNYSIIQLPNKSTIRSFNETMIV